MFLRFAQKFSKFHTGAARRGTWAVEAYQPRSPDNLVSCTGMASATRLRSAVPVLSWLVLSLICHVDGAVELKACSRVGNPDRIPQTYTGKLRIQWDSWPTSQITTALAAIILSENMGFDVVLEDAFSAKNMYEKMAEGQLLHLAFETWPVSNPKKSAEYGKFFNGTNAPPGKVNSYPYINLFGRAGIFETCPRSAGGCASVPSDTGVLLKDALKSPAGQQHFNVTEYVPGCSGADCEFIPPQCIGGQCEVQILHIAKTGV